MHCVSSRARAIRLRHPASSHGAHTQPEGLATGPSPHTMPSMNQADAARVARHRWRLAVLLAIICAACVMWAFLKQWSLLDGALLVMGHRNEFRNLSLAYPFLVLMALSPQPTPSHPSVMRRTLKPRRPP